MCWCLSVLTYPALEDEYGEEDIPAFQTSGDLGKVSSGSGPHIHLPIFEIWPKWLVSVILVVVDRQDRHDDENSLVACRTLDGVRREYAGRLRARSEEFISLDMSWPHSEPLGIPEGQLL